MKYQSSQNENNFYNRNPTYSSDQTCTRNMIEDDNLCVNDNIYCGLSKNQASFCDEAVQKNCNLLFQSNLNKSYSSGMSPDEILMSLLQQHKGEHTGHSFYNTVSPQGSNDSFDYRAMSPRNSDYESDSSSFTGLLHNNDSDYMPWIDEIDGTQQYKISNEFLQHQNQPQFYYPLFEIQEHHSYASYGDNLNNTTTYTHNKPYTNTTTGYFQEYSYRNLIGWNFEREQIASQSFNPKSDSTILSTTEYNKLTPTIHGTNNIYQPQHSKRKSSGKIKKPLKLQCATCSKIFSRPYNLKSHQKTHTKERPYICSYQGCRWSFARPHDLKRHTSCLHDDFKPYSCTCGKRFARSDAFKRHQAVDIACASKKKTKV